MQWSQSNEMTTGLLKQVNIKQSEQMIQKNAWSARQYRGLTTETADSTDPVGHAFTCDHPIHRYPMLYFMWLFQSEEI